MKTHVKLSLATVLLALTGLGARAYAAFSAPKDARAGFTATGPAGLTIEGSTPELNVADGDGKLVVDVPLGNLATGIALRDRHMKEKYLEVPKFPAATLIAERGSIKVPASGAAVSSDAPATLTLHGQTHPVTVHYDATADATGVAVRGKFHIRMDDFGIAVPSYLGVTVKPDVDVTARFHVDGN